MLICTIRALCRSIKFLFEELVLFEIYKYSRRIACSKNKKYKKNIIQPNVFDSFHPCQ